MTRFLCVGDLHGERISCDRSDFDAILCVGDLCGYELRDHQFAVIGTTENWYDAMGRDKAADAIERSVRQGREALASLAAFGKPVFLIPGNWDWTPDPDDEWEKLHEDRYRELVDSFENIIDVDEGAAEFEQLRIVGYGEVSHTELDEDSIEEELVAYESILHAYRALIETPWILLAHAPPFETSLDLVRNADSPRDGEHVGSLLVRDLLEDKPLVCLCGHMHENAGQELVEGVPVINLGEGKDAWLIIETGEELKIEGLDQVENLRS